jgi:hypothetical protein
MNEPSTAWHFERRGDMLTVIEPDGTRHAVQMGDWGSVAGGRLLNRMVKALSAPQIPPQTQHEAP